MLGVTKWRQQIKDETSLRSKNSSFKGKNGTNVNIKKIKTSLPKLSRNMGENHAKLSNFILLKR